MSNGHMLGEVTEISFCRQLGPVVRSPHAATGSDKCGLSVSLLEQFLDYNTACAPAKRIAGLPPATGEAEGKACQCPHL